MRTVPVPAWVKGTIDMWTTTANIKMGKLFRCVNKTGSVWGGGINEKVVWSMVRECASKAKLDKLAPHDLRRTCARLCHEAGGELEQIQFLLGHISVQTTERYLGCKQRLREAVNDKIGLEGSFGVFFSGRLVAHLYDERGAKLGTMPVADVSPTEATAIKTEISAPGKVGRLSLHLEDSNGLDRGALAEVAVGAGESR